MAGLVDSKAGLVIRLNVFLKVRLLMVRLLLMMMMIRLEMCLKAPARGWGHGCLDLDALILNQIRSHLPKAGRDAEESRFCGEGARGRAVDVFLAWASSADHVG